LCASCAFVCAPLAVLLLLLLLLLLQLLLCSFGPFEFEGNSIEMLFVASCESRAGQKFARQRFNEFVARRLLSSFVCCCYSLAREKAENKPERNQKARKNLLSCGPLLGPQLSKRWTYMKHEQESHKFPPPFLFVSRPRAKNSARRRSGTNCTKRHHKKSPFLADQQKEAAR